MTPDHEGTPDQEHQPRRARRTRTSRELAAEFDAFYHDSRARLLHQTYALTGDLPAARGAVRDAYLVAWHHWRKISRGPDPEAAVRPLAWRYARRRAGTRPWHREKDVGDDVRAVLTALATLGVEQRKALLLSTLAHTTMPALAREIGLPLEDAERELQSATARFSLEAEVPAGGVRAALELLGDVADAASWPRPTIIRRAGAARRRAHTSVGAVGAVVALVAAGLLVTDQTGVRPTLDGAGRTDIRGSVPSGPAVTLPDTSLLGPEEVAASVGGRGWEVGQTTDNSAGDGRAVVCQRERYLDPEGDAALVRTFRQTDDGGSRLVQAAEASSSSGDAAASYRRMLRWLSDCDAEQAQLVGVRSAEQVGDDAIVMTLRSWAEPASTFAVGVARTGAFTTTTMLTSPAAGADAGEAGREQAEQVATGAVSRALAAAVDDLCGLDDAGACATDEPTLEERPPPPASRYPALLNPADLPQVTGIEQPWTSAAVDAPSATAIPRCDDLTFTEPFRGTPFEDPVSRPFVVLDAGLPDEFGLTETVGSLPPAQAEAVVASVRDAYERCPERDLGSDVVRVADVDEGEVSYSAWQVTTELSEERTLRTATAIVRVGGAVAQIYFSAAEEAGFADGDFVALVGRAAERLAELPRTRR